ncbi:hypothetical protein ACIPSA_14365 [Streptomyces sp. NPDC086549]|uniref:hypothetical protein n=1 Tax=Streptomyces sp. NPDC086549 TaxID=3365752 RepID=UPI003812C58E
MGLAVDGAETHWRVEEWTTSEEDGECRLIRLDGTAEAEADEAFLRIVPRKKISVLGEWVPERIPGLQWLDRFPGWSPRSHAVLNSGREVMDLLDDQVWKWRATVQLTVPWRAGHTLEAIAENVELGRTEADFTCHGTGPDAVRAVEIHLWKPKA